MAAQGGNQRPERELERPAPLSDGHGGSRVVHPPPHRAGVDALPLRPPRRVPAGGGVRCVGQGSLKYPVNRVTLLGLHVPVSEARLGEGFDPVNIAKIGRHGIGRLSIN